MDVSDDDYEDWKVERYLYLDKKYIPFLPRAPEVVAHIQSISQIWTS